MRTVVLDTNVLLSDPGALLAYPDANVVIPETVLGEIDKLKISRVDPDLRFRGREVSRMLFEFSENGSLIEGFALPDGGTIRVAPLAGDVSLPEGLGTRNADDRILATAYQQCVDGCENLTLVTNDLNMLLKAQTYGIKVERRTEVDAGLGRRTIRWFQRYKTPITILAISVAVFAGVLALSFYTSRLTGANNGGSTGVPTEFRDLLSADERNLLDGLTALQASPNDPAAIKQVGNAYYQIHSQTGGAAYAQKGIDYYTRYLESEPDDTDVRTDMAVLYFYIGETDRAIQEASQVIEADPGHPQANFNLGVFYWRGRSDYEAASRQFITVIDLLADSSEPHDELIDADARGYLQTIKQEAEEAGVSVDIDPSYLPIEGSI
ncbi:MAG: PIN domain-containing protein [Coriobacteriia bacterium]|nr:PIN domain-containing protein [Coriobacteriia bacterium]